MRTTKPNDMTHERSPEDGGRSAALQSQALVAEKQGTVSNVGQGLRQNSQCFTCSRLYFGKTFNKCPRCGSDSVQHYSEGELGLLSRGLDDTLQASGTGATTLMRYVGAQRLLRKEEKGLEVNDAA